MSPGPRVTTQRIIDLPAPLGAQDEYATRRPAPAPRSEVAGPQKPRSQPLPAADDADAASSEGDVASSDPDEAPAAVSIPPETADSRTAIESLPTIELDEVAGGEPLELALNAPARKQLGGAATFRLTLRNTSEHPQDGLVIHCRFDDELVFAGSDEHEVLQRIDHLAAGEAKELAINLSSTAIGSHACRFVVMKREGDAEIELAHREASVEFVTRQVEIDLAGPTQRTEGSRAEFIVTLVNRSPKTIHDVQAVISFDKALVPKEASAEAVQNPGNLLWRLGPLESQEKVQLQVEFECRIKAHRACVSVDVKGINLTNEIEEACVEIVPVPGTLDLQIRDVDDPIEVGKTGSYEVTVHNIGLQAARGVALEVRVPEIVKILSVAVHSGDEVLTVKHAARGDVLAFDPLDQLAPNARVTYKFEVEALRAGLAEFRASLKSAISSAGVTVVEPTVIVAP